MTNGYDFFLHGDSRHYWQIQQIWKRDTDDTGSCKSYDTRPLFFLLFRRLTTSYLPKHRRLTNRRQKMMHGRRVEFSKAQRRIYHCFTVNSFSYLKRFYFNSIKVTEGCNQEETRRNTRDQRFYDLTRFNERKSE